MPWSRSCRAGHGMRQNVPLGVGRWLCLSSVLTGLKCTPVCLGSVRGLQKTQGRPPFCLSSLCNSTSPINQQTVQDLWPNHIVRKQCEGFQKRSHQNKQLLVPTSYRCLRSPRNNSSTCSLRGLIEWIKELLVCAVHGR